MKLNATEWMPERIMTPEQLAPRQSRQLGVLCLPHPLSTAPFVYLLVGKMGDCGNIEVQYQRILMLKNKKNASPGCIFSNSEA